MPMIQINHTGAIKMIATSSRMGAGSALSVVLLAAHVIVPGWPIEKTRGYLMSKTVRSVGRDRTGLGGLVPCGRRGVLEISQRIPIVQPDLQ